MLPVQLGRETFDAGPLALVDAAHLHVGRLVQFVIGKTHLRHQLIGFIEFAYLNVHVPSHIEII